ncbi:hypothetical protein [Sphingomonas sp.]|uniref:hypothetical protein n=1 Tax=Sphingomonas sp. TaxID=28214 RepID=UPI003BAD6119
MVLSNAEKQRRFRERLKARANSGVTPDDIVRAARLMWDYLREQDIGTGNDPGSFEDKLNHWRTRKGVEEWRRLHGDEDDPELWAEFGADADLMAKVAAVVRAVRFPPPDSDGQ